MMFVIIKDFERHFSDDYETKFDLFRFTVVETSYNALTSRVDDLVTQGQAVLTNHKQFEADLLKIETWLKEAKAACCHELLPDGALDALDAQVKKCQVIWE